MLSVMGDDSTAPATKGDLAAVKSDIAAVKSDLTTDIAAVKSDLATVKSDLVEMIQTEATETRRHFDVVAEQMLADFKGATTDAIEGLKDTDSKHHKRITHIETKLAIPLGA